MVPDSAPDEGGRSIRDVARLAGVSYQTVSRVLNDHPHVREETRARVRSVIADLDYRPSRTARSLSTKRSGVIGILVTSSAEYGPASCIQAIETAARARDYTVAVADTGGTEPEGVRSSLSHLISQEIESLVVIAPHGEAMEALDGAPRTMPTVTLQAPGRGSHPDLSVDQARGVHLAVEHLAGLGHTGIAHLAGPSDWLDASARSAAFSDEMSARGLRSGPALDGDWSARSGYEAGLILLDRRDVSAVFSSNDQMALGLLHAVHESGRRVPGDLSVIGFDDIPEAAHFWPPLTTIRQDFAELGRRCVDRLVGLESDAGSVSPVVPELIIRESTGPLDA